MKTRPSPIPQTRRQTSFVPPTDFDLQGHRGCRGLLPENSIPGFVHALDLGVVTLEMDVVITADHRVVVCHDPWVSPRLCRRADGSPIPEDDLPVIYGMDEGALAGFSCGEIHHPDFPLQRRVPTRIPSLKSVIEAAEQHARNSGRAAPRYNIETKSTPEGDHVLHPDPDTFADLLQHVLSATGIGPRTTVQSFDVRTLRRFRERYPEYSLSLLVEDALPFDQHLQYLGFVPEVYSPEFRLVTGDLVDAARHAGMKVIPWTVNEVLDMERLVRLGVDGLITDYPDRFPLSGSSGH